MQTSSFGLMPMDQQWPFFSSRRTFEEAIAAVTRWNRRLNPADIKVLRVAVTEVGLLTGWLRDTIQINARGDLRFMHRLPRRALDGASREVLLEITPSFATEDGNAAGPPVSAVPAVDHVTLGLAQDTMQVFIALTVQEANDHHIVFCFILGDFFKLS